MDMRLRDYKRFFVEQTNLRYQEMIRCRVRLQDGCLVPAQNYYTVSSGVSSLANIDGIRGFASSAEADDAHIRGVLERAQRNAKLLHARVNPPKLPLPKLENGAYETDYQMRAVDRQYMLDLARETDQYIQQHCRGVKSRTVVVHFDSIEKSGVTNNGYDAHTLAVRTHIMVFMTAQCDDGEVVTLDDYWGRRGYPEEVFSARGGMYEWIDKLYSELMLKREGVYTEAGYKDLILCPDLAGMLAHEAVGHTCEADMVLGGGVAAFNLDKRVASELVTLVDFAHHAFGEECHIPIYVDDEGTPAKDALIIDRGILKGYMHDRSSAAHFGVAPTGNARAYDYSDEPLIRMRNTVILPGQSSIGDMIASIDDGYILSYPANGQGDSTGEFMFGAGFGMEIKKGKLARPVRGATLSGLAFELLKSVDMVSADMNWRSGGMCGKKTMIQTAMAGPAIKCKANIGGR